MQTINLKAYREFLILFSIFMLPFASAAQHKPKVIVKSGETLRLESDSKKMVDAVFTLVVPADRDTTSKKKDYAVQDSLKLGKLLVELDKESTTADLSKMALAVNKEFKLDSLKQENQFRYAIRVPRDSLDDKRIVLNFTARDVKGNLINQLKRKLTIYIKPFVEDSLASNEKLELWFHTGTNFDLFDGVKAEEFFFRANMFFKVTERIYTQMAFYKNRYFAEGENNSQSREFATIRRPLMGESLYTFTEGRYKQSSKQTVDPLAWQLDFLYKYTNDKQSNYFLNVGIETSTTTVTIENKYTIDTLRQFQTTQPDTVHRVMDYNEGGFSGGFKYRKPASNLNIGLMWVFNDSVVNIKAQLLTGLSIFSNLLYIRENRGGTSYAFEVKRRPYMQARVMATYKPIGLTFGMEAFIRNNEVPAFNFTLSKAFDLKKLVSNLTPVSNLKL